MSLSLAFMFFVMVLALLAYRALQRRAVTDTVDPAHATNPDTFATPDDAPAHSNHAPKGFALHDAEDAFLFSQTSTVFTDTYDAAQPDWITVGQTTCTLELARADDCIVMIWDDAHAAKPDVTVRRNRRTARVALNGVEVATVVGRHRFSASDVVLIPQSRADKSGLSTL